MSTPKTILEYYLPLTCAKLKINKRVSHEFCYTHKQGLLRVHKHIQEESSGGEGAWLLLSHSPLEEE